MIVGRTQRGKEDEGEKKIKDSLTNLQQQPQIPTNLHLLPEECLSSISSAKVNQEVCPMSPSAWETPIYP